MSLQARPLKLKRFLSDIINVAEEEAFEFISAMDEPRKQLHMDQFPLREIQKPVERDLHTRNWESVHI